MGPKDIAVLVDEDSRAALRFAISLAADQSAHLTVVGLVLDPTASLLYSQASVSLAEAALADARAEARRIADEAAVNAQQSLVPVSVELVEVLTESARDDLARQLQRFDLTVIEQPSQTAPKIRPITIEAALFGSGRPLFVVPYVYEGPAKGEAIMIAWSDTPPSARALNDALPWLKAAKKVDLVVVDEGGGEDHADARAGVLRHLARHGIMAELHAITNAGALADTLLSYAFDRSADILVMGGYGHSRFREFLLGGATRGVLRSMTLPVLMSH